jgi:hypothetical protein
MMREVVLLMEGRSNSFTQLEHLFKYHAAVTSDVVNITMGGPGAFKQVMSGWRTKGDQVNKPMTNEERKAIIKRYQERQK